MSTSIGGVMRRFSRIVVVLLLAVSIGSVLTGCGDDKAAANAAIDASNAAVEKANEYDAQAVKLFDQIGSLKPGGTSSERALELIAQAEVAIKNKNAQVKVAIDELSKISSMDVTDDFKTYAKQQIELAQLQKQSNDLLLEATAEFRAVFENAASAKPNTKALDQSFAKIEEVFADADRLSTKIDEKAGASDAFFQEKRLGE